MLLWSLVANYKYPIDNKTDIAVLKTLLASQEQSYRGALEVYMKNMSDKMQGLESTITASTRSLQFTQKEVDDSKRIEKTRRRPTLKY